jgi:hypothetical protein
MVWGPAHLEEHFRRFGFESAMVRFVSAQPTAEMARYQRLYWTVGLPLGEVSRDLKKALFAAAALHENEPLLTLVNFATMPDQEHAGQSIAVVSVSAVVSR